MLSKNVVLIALAVVFLTVGSGLAQTEKGDSEVQLLANSQFTVGQNPDVITFLLFGNYGRFVTNRTELGGGITLSFLHIEGAGSNTTVGSNFFYRYNFSKANRKVMPYISADIRNFDVSVSDTWAVRPGVGVKSFVNENVAFDLNAGYNFFFSDADQGVFDVSFGLSYIF